MFLEHALLASQEEDSIVEEAAVKVAAVALEAGGIKRPANSPSNGDDKRQRVTLRNKLKIMIERQNADVDDGYFHNLYGEIFDRQQNLTGEFLPTFYNSGHTRGIGWFSACDEPSLSWLKTVLEDIRANSDINDFVVKPYSPIPQLRRIIFAVPHFPKMDKSGNDKIMSMITRLNVNFDTKYWKITKILPPANGMRSIVMSIDEESIVKLIDQGNKLFYGLSQVTVKIYPKISE